MPSVLREAVQVRGSIVRLGGLDGLRGLAVVAVLLYHAGLLRGGFLGVEIFFAISGYLITWLLVSEWQRDGRIAISGFWLRRIRRLWPASFAVIIGVLGWTTLALPDELLATRNAALAGVLSVSNWYAILVQQSYFEAVGRPPLLRHLWSLAIEAQFYALWPLVLAAGLRFQRVRLALIVAVVGGLASASLMAALYQPDADPSRVYYGTDTRASGLLIGAALALARRSQCSKPVFLSVAGFAALAGLAAICATLGEFDALLYRGGFLLVDALSVLAIAAAVDAGAKVWFVLDKQPLRWIGVRSYGIYLWHWPVFMLTRPQLDIRLDGVPVLLARLALVAILAELSFRFVEQPFRRGAPGRVRTIAGLATGALVLATSVGAKPAERPTYLPVDAIDTWSEVAVATPTADLVAAETPVLQVAAVPPATPRVTAIGDSVMLGAASALQSEIPGIEVDAAVSRQTAVAIDLLRTRGASGQLGDVVIVHMGNNGTFSAAQFDTMMALLADVLRVVFVNVKVPRAWEGSNDEVLADGVSRYPNAVLVDWRGASLEHPDFFWDDAIHLRPEGAAAYAALIASSIAG